MHNSSEYLLTRKSIARHVLGKRSADRRQALCEFHYIFVLRAFADVTEGRMVAILFSAPGIAPCCLEMTVGLGADPYIRPCGRDGELTDALQCLLIPYPGSW